MNDTRIAILEKIETLKLQEYDWGGNGELPLRHESYWFITSEFLSRRIGVNIEGVPILDVTMDDRGVPLLDFGGKTKRRVKFWFPTDGVILYRRHMADGVTRIDGIFRFSDDEKDASRWGEVNELLKWVSGKTSYA